MKPFSPAECEAIATQRHLAVRVYQTMFTVFCGCGRPHWSTATFTLSLN